MDGPASAKADLRRTLLAERRTRASRTTAAGWAGAAERLAGAAPRLPGDPGSTVAAFLPLPDEPPVLPLLAALVRRGRPVLLPVLAADLDLDWTSWRPDAELEPGLRGTRHPVGPRLGRDAVARCGVVLLPALAVDRAGRRLGRGGGSYDRVLARLPPAVLRVAVVAVDEVRDGPLPVEAHDRPVDAVLTDDGRLHLFP